jgi:hypothetical protein
MPSWAATLEAEIRILAVIGAGSFAFWAFSAQAVPHPLAKLSAGDGEACLMERTGQEDALGWHPVPCNESVGGQCHLAKCFRWAVILRGGHQPLGLVRHGAAVEWGP